MDSTLKKGQNRMLITTIITLIIGLLLTIAPTTSIEILVKVVSIIFIIVGCYFIYDYIRSPKDERTLSFSLAFGIIVIGLGIFLFLKSDVPIKLFTIVIGIGLLIKGIYKLQLSLNLKDISDKWSYNLVVSLFLIVMGIILALYPYGTVEVFLRVIGIIITIESIIELVESTMVTRSIKTNEKVEEDNHDEKEAKEIDFKEKKSTNSKKNKSKNKAS